MIWHTIRWILNENSQIVWRSMGRKLWPNGRARAAAKEKNFPHYFEMVYILSALQIIFICIPKIILVVLPLITTFSSSCLFSFFLFSFAFVSWAVRSISSSAGVLDSALESMLREIRVTQRPNGFVWFRKAGLNVTDPFPPRRQYNSNLFGKQRKEDEDEKETNLSSYSFVDYELYFLSLCRWSLALTGGLFVL